MDDTDVTPFVGVWIETTSLYNGKCSLSVTPFVGVWIETYNRKLAHIDKTKSHPSWVCGLKQRYRQNHRSSSNVTPFVGVWIETVRQ